MLMDYMFGHTPCAILADAELQLGKHVAHAYVIEGQGNDLRPLANPEGREIQFEADSRQDLAACF
jgi:hypothetical protein